MMFHLANNIYFERGKAQVKEKKDPIDVVKIVVRDGDLSDGDVVKEIVVPMPAFASLVAAMSARGESGQTHSDALHFLMRPV